MNMSNWVRNGVVAVAACCTITPGVAAGPSHVDITWMSIANVYYQFGNFGILTDGYISRIPLSEFYGGGGGLEKTHKAYKPDVDAVRRVLKALGGRKKVNLLLTGHSHFDHSFDTAAWSKLTGARIIGSKTTCLQAEAQSIPVKNCTAVYGGEKLTLANGVTMRVVRWNHSGSSAANPEQHDPVELDSIPHLDAANGGLHGGVGEDFPNGGGSRGFLFTVDGPEGRFSWFFQNSAAAGDLGKPIIIGGVNYGAPIDNLKAALQDAGLTSVDLWIGTGGLAVAKLVLPILHPKAYLPVHWDGLWGAFDAGAPRPYRDPSLEKFLVSSGVELVRPVQYMDQWRLDHSGIKSQPNTAVKQTLGFSMAPASR
jgi:hypothetical protein